MPDKCLRTQHSTWTDRCRPRYEMEKSFDRMAELMKKNAQAVMMQIRYTVREQAKETLDETIAHDEKVDKRFDKLELALEGLSGMAIVASNRDRQQQTLLEQVLARLTDLEKKVHPPLPHPPRLRVWTWRWEGPAPRHPRPRPRP